MVKIRLAKYKFIGEKTLEVLKPFTGTILSFCNSTTKLFAYKKTSSKTIFFILTTLLLRPDYITAEKLSKEIQIEKDEQKGYTPSQENSIKMYDKMYVISLDRSPERYEYMKNQLNKFNLKHERFPAVDGKLITIRDTESNLLIPWQKMNNTPSEYYSGATLKISYKDRYKDAEFFYIRDKYLLNFGQLGCAMSHRAVWADIVRYKLKRAIVLEDDVSLDKDFYGKLSLLMNNLPDDFDLFFLDITLIPLQNKTSFMPPHFWLSKFCNTQSAYYAKIRPNTNVCGTRGYIINFNSAQKLLEKTKHLHMPIDNTMMFSGLTLYVSKIKLLSGTRMDSVIGNVKEDNEK